MFWPTGWTLADLFEEPGNQRAQNEWVIGFPVMKGEANVAGVPQVPFPAVQVPGCRTNVKQDHIGAALNQPAAKMNLQHENQEVHWAQIFNFQNLFKKKFNYTIQTQTIQRGLKWEVQSIVETYSLVL